MNARTREHIRATLTPNMPHLQYLAAAVGYRLPTPDPESALVYLRALRKFCDELLDDARAPSAARRGGGRA